MQNPELRRPWSSELTPVGTILCFDSIKAKVVGFSESDYGYCYQGGVAEVNGTFYHIEFWGPIYDDKIGVDCENVVLRLDESIAGWFWCETCDEPAVRCADCGNISCSGGGCNKCYVLFEHVTDLINKGQYPPKEELPILPKFDWNGMADGDSYNI